MLSWRDIVTYIRLFLRWWYVLAIAVLIATGAAWSVARNQPDLYISQATLMVGDNFAVAAPNESAVKLSNVLASYYAAMVKREVILAPVADLLQLRFPWTLIRDRMLFVGVDPGANLLEIRITDTDPNRAAAIANAIADQLIAYTPNASEDAEAQRAEIERQLQETQANLKNTEARIAEVEQRLSTLSSAIDISDVQKQLDALESARDKYVEDYSRLIVLSNQSSVNTLTLFEQARPSPLPLPKKLLLTLVVAAIGGLMLAVLAVLLLDKLDERWRTAGELQFRTGLRPLGEVPGGQPLSATPGLASNPRREHALREVYANMMLAASSELPRSLLVSSPRPSAARSALALDIAEMYVLTGHRVMLVDAETNRADLTGLLADKPGSPGQNIHGPGRQRMPRHEQGSGLLRFVRSTARPQILLLSCREAGYDRLAAMVPSIYWPDLVRHLRQAADIVIFDGPAALTGPDAGLLAPVVDGVLLVLNGKEDTRTSVIKAQKQLASQPAAKFLGAIVASRVARDRLVVQPAHEEAASSGGMKIVVGARGITISFGAGPPAVEPQCSQAWSQSGPKLLTAAIPDVSETPSPRQEACDQPKQPLTWEQLLEMEHRAVAAERAAASDLAAGRWAEHPQPPVIITPPPEVEKEADRDGMGRRNGAPRPRRRRIANIGRPQRDRTLATGASDRGD